jgi:RNase P subunit RPR2
VSCTLCGKLLSSESALQKHVSSVHEKIRRFACEHCDHKASTPGNLQQHIDSFHLGIKHECDICQAGRLYSSPHHSILYIGPKSGENLIPPPPK